MQINGYFRLSNRAEGSFLILYPSGEGGAALSFSELDTYLTLRGITYPKKEVAECLNSLVSEKEILISERTLSPLNEKIMIDVDLERLTAIAKFYPPTEDGNQLDEKNIRDEIRIAKVKYGVIDQAIDDFLKNRTYCTPYLVAEALKPVEGSNAEITYHFNTNLTRKPKTNEDGSVNFHELDMLSPIQEGDLLASLKPAVQGVPGMDVYGQIIKPLAVQVMFLRQGKNIRLSEAGTALYSMVNGHVTLVENQVFVSDNFEVASNVDTSTGNISYNGNITVQGNVNTGYRVEASGDIIVNGVVEGAHLTAGGQIILKRGIQGMGRGILEAGTNVISKFIESAEIHAGGFVVAEAILHSNVYAKGDVTVGGKRGFISGGEVKSASAISAKTAGSVMGTATVLEVGIDPKLLKEFHVLDKELVELKKELASIAQQIALITKRMKAGTLQGATSVIISLNNDRVLKENKLSEVKQKLNQYTKVFNEMNCGYVLIDDVIHPGCKLVISNATTYIRKPTKHSRFVKEEGDIRVKAY